MCKWCQHCLESCYWHLIEKRFCFDESIALYSEPVISGDGKEEKNNNLFDNIAFYDSVAVIAGRAVVTIDPLPATDKKKDPVEEDNVIVQQPRRLTWRERMKNDRNKNHPRNLPALEEKTEPTREEPTKAIARIEELKNDERTFKASSLSSAPSPAFTLDVTTSEDEEEDTSRIQTTRRESVDQDPKFSAMNKSFSCGSILDISKDPPDSIPTVKSENSLLDDMKVELRKKSISERRLSKSLYLKIDFPKELPIIRQSSVPKFYLDTPEQNQTESSLIKTPLTALQSPMICDKDGFCFDLKSVVQMQNLKQQVQPENPNNIHRESSRLTHIKEKIKLKKSKSTLSANNLPYTNHI
ncbi:unnamed protein product [Acanthoscelides obtectus]|uniref:Uncharacterized protein n=1 Tax=Acanthoscelides obtectus TaxID=200917 RepID=A0A9P0KEZ3_ACAOB|nr:unnamed protein product [Acanthoscelides obtectus]CAK1657557.1 hypothetical protein AOBTE_LOCUS20418 [Acanthoscelides obtectus]